MKTDYFSDLLPDFVTTVTSNQAQPVTPEKTGNELKNSGLPEALPVLPLLPEKTGNTQHETPRTLRVYRYRLRDCPGSDLILIAPGTDMAEATRGLRLKYGDRLLDVAEYNLHRALK